MSEKKSSPCKMTTPERHCQLVMESQRRHIEKDRARHRLMDKIRRGKMLPAREFLCLDCKEKADCYDHANGYDGDNALKVDPVCWKCHRIRGVSRKEYKNGFTIKMVGVDKKK